MQAVPSIVGTGTVVAAAAVGLVFGQPSESSHSRPPSNKRKLTPDYQSPRGPPLSSRPGTSTTANVPRSANVDDLPCASSQQQQQQRQQQHLPLQPLSSTSTNTARPLRTHSSTQSQLTPPKTTSRRHSFIRQNEGVPPPIAENWRDSVSSNGSWMRRLSIRPLSQHGSPRSSVGPDSPSLTFSYGSGAPILPSVSSTPPQLPPNKLVKRTTTTAATETAAGNHAGHTGTLSRRGSRSQMPSLRRPATSHQRSATLQQVQHQGRSGIPGSQPKCSLDQQIRPSLPSRTPLDISERSKPEPHRWTSFFHSTVVQSTPKGSISRTSESSPNPHQLPSRIIHIRKGSTPRAYLIDASMMSTATPPRLSVSSPRAATAIAAPSPTITPTARAKAEPAVVESRQSPEQQHQPREGQGQRNPSATPEDTPSKKARRSISMHFSSPTTWISKSGSIRRQKRGQGAPESKSGGVRNVSAPTRPTSPIMAQDDDVKQDLEQLFAPPSLDKREGALTLDVSASSQTRTRQRNLSSPLPPLSRLSSFNVDLYRVGASSSSSTAPRRQEQLQASPLLVSPKSFFPVSPHSRDVSNERASTLAGSDLEMRAFMSGDDDDTDFKSDTMFDSFRTSGSARRRNVETPLESMFDESPPSTAGNSKTKRLSIQEILGRSWDGDTRIMEEDEGVPTPIRRGGSSHGDVRFSASSAEHAAAEDSFDYENHVPEFSLSGRDFGRLSLDDDDDYDWARDEENGLCNHLSPPSSSLNSRGVSPNLRMALASLSGNGSPESLHYDAVSERPRSNVFDWSEPPNHDRFDADGQSPRPKTVHGKQESDARGGRAAHRKGPAAAHVRSQSVPVVPDPAETAGKSGNKFRTWASGPKNASEDWEEDFDFDESSCNVGEGKNSTASFSMVVPASIQATQPTVKAHSGQIRELSLLVNGLKRLCRLGRDLNLLDESAELWKEAHNIIALASPDEDENEEADTDGTDSADFDPSAVDQQYVDEGFDASALSHLDDPFELREHEISKTAVVRERQVARRRSVFSPEDDIFGGGWALPEDNSRPTRPETPVRPRDVDPPDSAIIASVMEAMQQQRRSSSAPVKGSPMKPSNSKLFFDTNSLQELVKRANSLFHTLSDTVRRAELITQSPAGTPKRERHLRSDGSPAFTRVFTDPAAASPPKRLPKTHSTNSVLGRTSIDSRSSNSIGPRMQMMIVS